MAKVIDKTAVTVSEKNSDNSTRRITIEIEASANLFALSDLLAKEKALEPLLPLLKRSTKATLADYIQSEKQALKAAAQAAALTQASTKTAPPKKPAAERN